MTYRTITLPAMPLTPEMVKAIELTGKTITVQRDGETYQGRLSIVEARTWSTTALDNGECALDVDCTPTWGREEPYAAYDWTTPWGQVTTQWAKLSQVRKGVSLAKRAR